MLHEDEGVFRAVQKLVLAGEYRDELPGRPGEDLTGGGAFERAPDGRPRRLHWRGDPGFRAGRRTGRIPPLPPLTPAPAEAVAELETALGTRLPALLRRCYTELGDGGFGPAYGLPGLVARRQFHAGTMLETYRAQRKWPQPWRERAEALLPICDWGGGVQSFVDLTDATMWALDPYAGPADQLGLLLFPQPMTLTEWLGRWTAGALHQPAIIRDQATGRLRPAVDADHEEEWLQVA
ncbi:SMI1/KNR4 family protein [Symbioplanes lichenis]|uniref:SMI1/KNR4 family protein n=1 Tax=Symbioplanes lichenis TaxID=1629072 RepID=UPI002738E727|nr:SMI1/KNR4 family protein [Actinoplanes lichenis]